MRSVEAYHGVLAARAIIVPINTRLTPGEAAYILEHSGAKLVLLDHELAHLVTDTTIPVVVTRDDGRPGNPYEDFLSAGRAFSQERGWAGLVWEKDEDAAMALCYTCVLHLSYAYICAEETIALVPLAGYVAFSAYVMKGRG